MTPIPSVVQGLRPALNTDPISPYGFIKQDDEAKNIKKNVIKTYSKPKKKLSKSTWLHKYMAASAKDPPLKLTSMLIGISLIKILAFYKIFFVNELRVKFLSSLKKKSVKNSE